MGDFYTRIRDCGFDLVFFDECHKTTCGPKYATASLFLNTWNVYGLSATPFADNLHKIMMHCTIGNIVAVDDQYELVPKINFVQFDSGLHQQFCKFVYQAGDMLRQRSRYISKLTKSAKYKQIMVDLVRGMLTDGHRIIIIVFTVDLVKSISQWLDEVGIENRQFYSKKIEIDKENDKVVVATYGYAGAGFDMKQLSGAILGTPLSGKKSLIQVIGRILRSFHGKVDPVVYDLIEEQFGGMFMKDLPRKIGILKNEFNCEFNHIKM
jgi:superfamily II DNA or RNA helicase